MFPTKAHIVPGIAGAIGIAGGTLLALAACNGEPEYPETPYPDAGAYEPAPTPTYTATEPYDAGAPPPPTTQTGPCDGTMNLAMQTAIQARAKSELAQGMKPESTFMCEYVTEGGAATLAVNLLPGHCYTFLAHSYPNVTELDLMLKPNFGQPVPPLLLPFANVVLAQDSDTGPTAAIGRGQSCFKNPLPVPGVGLIEVRARTGSGPVGVQIYMRKW